MSHKSILFHHNDGVNSKIGENPKKVDKKLSINGSSDYWIMGGGSSDPLAKRLITQVHEQRVDPNENLQPPRTWLPYQTLFYAPESLNDRQILGVDDLRRRLQEFDTSPFRTLVRTHEVRKQGKHKTTPPSLPGFFVLFLFPPGHKPEREIKPDIIENLLGPPIFSLLEAPGGKPRLETGKWSSSHAPETVWEKLTRSHDNLCLSLSYREGEQFVALDAFPTNWKASITAKAETKSISPSVKKEIVQQAEKEIDHQTEKDIVQESQKQTEIQRFAELFRSKNPKPISQPTELWESFHEWKYASKYNGNANAASLLEQFKKSFYKRCDSTELQDPEGFWREDVLQQIEAGDIRVGLNPVGEDGECRWIAVDIDRGDFPTIAETYGVNEADLLNNAFWINLPGEPGLVWERSASGGVHGFAFFSDYINAEAGIAYGKDIIQRLKLPEETEIFPKQTSAKFGNFVWLPPLKAIDCSWREGERHGFMKPDALLSVSPISIDDISQETHNESAIPSQSREDSQEQPVGKGKGKSTSNKGRGKLKAVFLDCVGEIEKVREGGRNKALMHEAGKLYQIEHKINWAEELNRWFPTPLPDDEVAEIHKCISEKEEKKKSNKRIEEEKMKRVEGRLKELQEGESFGGISIFDDWVEDEDGDEAGFERFELGPAFTAEGTGETRLEVRISKKFQRRHPGINLPIREKPEDCSFRGEWNPQNCTSILVDFDSLHDIGIPNIAIPKIAAATRLAIPCSEGHKKNWRLFVPPLLRSIQVFYEHDLMTSSRKEDILTVSFINTVFSKYPSRLIENKDSLRVDEKKVSIWRTHVYFKWDAAFQDLGSRYGDFLSFKKQIGRNINSLPGCSTTGSWRVGASGEGKNPRQKKIRSAKLSTFTLMQKGFDIPALKKKGTTTATKETPKYDGNPTADEGRIE